MSYLTHGALVGFIVFEVVVLLVIVTNGWVMRRAHGAELPAEAPTVSVLVPARNEEAKIGICVASLLAQRYPRLELIVLDDRSTDGTLAILDEIQRRDCRVQVLQGEPVPEGWTGKNWACFQLANASHGAFLLFADADTVFEPDAVATLVARSLAENADLLSGVPRQLLGTLGEKLIVPLFPWALFSFAPLLPGLLSPKATPVRAVGQMMLFQREAYESIGGHASVRAGVLDDIGLSARIRDAGLRLRLTDVSDVVSCRMYASGHEAFDGFGKNVFAVFGYRLVPYVFVWVWLGFVYVEPVAALTLHLVAPSAVPLHAGLLGGAVALALAQWLLAYRYFRLPVWPALVYPLTMLVFDLVALRSLVDALRGRSYWRGRVVEHPPVRLL